MFEQLLNFCFEVKNFQIDNHISFHGDISPTKITSYRRLPPNQYSIGTRIHDFIRDNNNTFNGEIRLLDIFNALTTEFKPINVLKVLADTNVIPSLSLSSEIMLSNDYEVIEYFGTCNYLCYINLDLINKILQRLIDEPNETNLKIFKVACRKYKSHTVTDMEINKKYKSLAKCITLDIINEFKNLK